MGSPETCPTEGWVLIGGADYGGPIPTDPWVVGPIHATRREAIAAVYPDPKKWAKARRGSQSGIRVWCVHTTSQAYAGAVKPATPAPPATVDAGAAERDNSIYDDAAEYLAERDAMIAEREAHRAVVEATEAVVQSAARVGLAIGDRNNDEVNAALVDMAEALVRLAALRGTKGGE